MIFAIAGALILGLVLGFFLGFYVASTPQMFLEHCDNCGCSFTPKEDETGRYDVCDGQYQYVATLCDSCGSSLVLEQMARREGYRKLHESPPNEP